jgi:hypothetical protein
VSDHPLAQGDRSEYARWFRAPADPTRILIIDRCAAELPDAAAVLLGAGGRQPAPVRE